jgi:hypothetical protein
VNEASPLNVAAENVSVGAIPHRDDCDKPSAAEFAGNEELAGIAAIAFVDSVDQGKVSSLVVAVGVTRTLPA